MEKAVQIPTGADRCIKGVHFKPLESLTDTTDQLLVVMIHGFPGNKNTHDHVFQQLGSLIGDKNYHSLRFDFTGCGESDGYEESFSLDSTAKDLRAVNRWAEERGYKRFIFVCEGLGAPIALLNAQKQALCYIFLWPMLDMPRIATTVFQSENIAEEWKKAGYILMGENRVGTHFIEQLAKTNVADDIRDLKRPILIMHGAQDETSPIGQLDIVRKNASARRIEITSFHDGTHGLPELNHRKAMFYHIMQFMEKYA